MTSYTMPDTARTAVAELNYLGELVSAQEWHRAALIASLIGPNKEFNSWPFTLQELVELQIVGLRDEDTILRYRDAWCSTENGGAGLAPPGFGSTIEIPELPWPANRTVGRGMSPERREHLMQAGQAIGMKSGSKVVDIANNPKSMAAAIGADEQTFRVAQEAVNQRLLQEHEARVLAARLAGTSVPRPKSPEAAIMADLMEVKNKLRDAADQVRESAPLSPHLNKFIGHVSQQIKATCDYLEGTDFTKSQDADEALARLLDGD